MRKKNIQALMVTSWGVIIKTTFVKVHLLDEGESTSHLSLVHNATSD